MTELFLKIVNMSIAASWLVMAVLVLRLVLNRMPKWVIVLLWGMVAIRLICPFSIESSFSFIPSTDTIPYDIALDTTPMIDTGISPMNHVINSAISESNTPAFGDSVNPLQVTLAVLANLWVIGMGIMTTYMFFSYGRLYRKVRTAICLQKNIFQSENVDAPFVLGVVNPKIYIPFAIGEAELAYVTAHEQAHICRRDHWWKLLSYLLLILHWFNPLIWLSYFLLCRDIELACDEKVIKELGYEQRADYSQALLSCSMKHKMAIACPLSFGEVGVKKRIKAVLHYKKPAFWAIVLSVIVCVMVAICFLTNPKQENIEENLETRNDMSDNISDNMSDNISNNVTNTTSNNIVASDSSELEETTIDTRANEILNGMAYYLELSAQGKEFQNMQEKQRQKLLEEYKELLTGYSFLARESTDGTASYIIGTYHGNVEKSPLSLMHSLERTGPDTNGETVQILYRELEEELLELKMEQSEMLSKEDRWEVSYMIWNSHMSYSLDKSMILIQPDDSKISFIEVFGKCLTQEGRAYMEDALSRGIVFGGQEETYLDVYLISETYGEISETIPLTEAEAKAILAEEQKPLEKGFGFSAGLYVNGETEYYSERNGVPQTVLELAVEKCGYQFDTPASIDNSIVEARLDCEWLETPLYAKESDLEHLKEILTNAKHEGVGGCGYYAKLTLSLSDGEKVVAFKGCDGCDTMVFGSFGGYLIGDKENEAFWEIFGLDIETKELLK